jgi:hypothetical protein
VEEYVNGGGGEGGVGLLREDEREAWVWMGGEADIDGEAGGSGFFFASVEVGEEGVEGFFTRRFCQWWGSGRLGGTGWNLGDVAVVEGVVENAG